MTTLDLLNGALLRIIQGVPTRIPEKRKLSISAVEAEAGLSNGCAHYYPDFIEHIKQVIAEGSSNNRGLTPRKKLLAKLKDEERKRKKYREQVSSLRRQISIMAAERHQITDVMYRLQCDLAAAQKEIDELKMKAIEAKRGSLSIIKPREEM